MKLNAMQAVRLILMVLAIAGIIYAVEYVPRGIAVWFWDFRRSNSLWKWQSGILSSLC